jgi:hypothetical protein
MTPTTINRLCAAITDAAIASADVFCEDVVLEATVPNWHDVRPDQDVVRADLYQRDGRIARDTVRCGGGWPASLLAEMEEARLVADRDSGAVGA